jgi:rubrerythrin
MSDYPVGGERGDTAATERDAEANDRGRTPNPAASAPAGEEPTCAACGKSIRQDDIVCPHCGTPLVAG